MTMEVNISIDCGLKATIATDKVIVFAAVTVVQKLINIYNEYAYPHYIIYYADMTICMMLKLKPSKGAFATTIELNNVTLKYTQKSNIWSHSITQWQRQ